MESKSIKTFIRWGIPLLSAFIFANSLSQYVNGIMKGYEPAGWLLWLYAFLTASPMARWSIVAVAIVCEFLIIL